MKKSLTKNLFLVIATLMLLLPVVSAFDLKANLTSNTVCPSSTLLLQHTLTTPTALPFTVSISGSASSFATTVPTGFWLGANQSKTIYTYITPSNRVAPGAYTIKVTAESSGVTQSSEQTIIVENCHNTALAVEPETTQVCACESKTIKLNIINNGKYLENYKISAEGPAANWLNLSATNLALAANASSATEAYLNIPCDVKGDYEINFIVESSSKYSRATKKAGISVVQCFDYALASEKSVYSMCEAESQNIPVTIKNLGTKANTYLINYNGPEWTQLDQKELTIANNSEKSFNIIAKPPYTTSGKFNATAEVLSDSGKVLKKIDLEIEVTPCYGVALTVDKASDKICNALSNDYAVIVKNTGKFENTYDLSIEGPAWAVLEANHFTLNASAEKTVNLKVSPPFNTSSVVNNITIKAIDPVSKMQANATLALETITVESCYKPSVSVQNNSTQITLPRDSTAAVSFIIENKGTNEANYALELSGTATFAQLNPGAVTIKPNEVQTVYLYIAPPLETTIGNYSATVTARLADTTILASRSIDIIVTGETENATDITIFPENVTTNVTIETNATNETCVATNETNGTCAIANETNATITGETVETQPRVSLWSRFVAWLVKAFGRQPTAEAINLTAVNETGANESIVKENQVPILKDNISDITIAESGSYKLDLADYFEDPDKDALTFLAIAPTGVKVMAVGSTMELAPEAKFTGTTTITFYASDGKAVAASNAVKITVGTVTAPAANETAETNQTNQTAGNETNQTA